MPARPAQGGSNGTWGTELNAWLDGGHDSQGRNKPDSTIWLPDYFPVHGGDNTGTDYCDDAFIAAIAAAQALTPGYPGAPANALVTGPAGTYKLGRYFADSGGTYYGPSLGIPSGVQFGMFGGGANECAQFYFPNESALPTAIGVVDGATSNGQTTLPLKNVKNVFAPASPTYPQTVWAHFLNGLITYTGITGSGHNITLTGVTGINADWNGYAIVGNSYVINARSEVWKPSIDQTITVRGPGTGSRAAWLHGSTLNGAVTAAQATIPLVSTAGWPTSGGQVMLAEAKKGQQTITYTGISGNSLTGCAGSTGTIASGASAVYVSPPTAADGIFMGARGYVDCGVTGFRMGTVAMDNHETWGPNFHPWEGGCYSFLCLESPYDYAWAAVSSGNQFTHQNVQWESAIWAPFYISASNNFVGAVIQGSHAGGCQFVFWKESLAGLTNYSSLFMQYGSVSGLVGEACGLGFAACPDANSLFRDVIFTGNSFSDLLVNSINNLPPLAEFACGITQCTFNGDSLLRASPTYPWVLGNVTATFNCGWNSLAAFITGRAAIASTNDHGGYSYMISFPEGMVRHNAAGIAIPAGSVLMMKNITGGVQEVKLDDGTGAIVGIAPVAWVSKGGGDSVYIGPVITNQRWGEISVNCGTATISPGDLVRSNGTVTPGQAIRWTAGEASAPFGRALSVAGGTAVVLISPALA